MTSVCILLLLIGNVAFNEAYNLRTKETKSLNEEPNEEPSFFQVHKESAEGENPIPDPSCKKGVMSPDMKVCCTDTCGSCGNHKLCDNVGKYNEVTGKLADNCCKDRILKKATSCDKNHPPCVLSASYKESIDKYVIERPKRHAMDDCNKAIPIARSKHALGIEKGEFFSQLYLEARTKYEEAKEIADKVANLCTKKTVQSKEHVEEYSRKVAEAKASDKVKDPLSGLSKVNQWNAAGGDEKAEVTFYDMILGNANEVSGLAAKGLKDVKSLRAEVEKVKDTQKYVVTLNSLIDDANQVHADAKGLWKQWEDSSKDYSCGVPPSVPHAGAQCTEGNTKFSPRCQITCELGYDGKGTQNELRATDKENLQAVVR